MTQVDVVTARSPTSMALPLQRSVMALAPLCRTLVMLCVSMLVLLSPPASAQTYRQITKDQLEQLMKAEGYATRRDADDDIVWTQDGLRWFVFVMGNGSSIQARFAVGDTKTSLERINEWNRTKRYSKSYLDRDGDPVLSLDLDLVGGVDRARIVDFFRTATASRSAWIKQVFDK